MAVSELVEMMTIETQDPLVQTSVVEGMTLDLQRQGIQVDRLDVITMAERGTIAGMMIPKTVEVPMGLERKQEVGGKYFERMNAIG